MLNPGSNFAVDASWAISAGADYLASVQRADGCWSDYQLQPGSSEAWTTAVAAYALSRIAQSTSYPTFHLNNAISALIRAKRSDGWGFNQNTASDADSTSWSIRFLLLTGDKVSAATLLGNYLSPAGAAHTFSNPDRFGSWALEHDEVTPLAGMALLEAGELRLVQRVRRSVIETWRAKCGWQPFWWTDSAYAIAQSLEFLRASGGIPADIVQTERERLAATAAADNPFDASQQLLSACHLQLHEQSDRLARSLIACQQTDGAWPASATLRVPDQRDASMGSIHADHNRVLGTAFSLMALLTTELRLRATGGS